MANKDTLVVNISDLHSGSTSALFPNRRVDFVHGNHTPTELQSDIYAFFMRCADHVRNLRKRKRLVIVHNGDAIDGDHHSTLEIVTRREIEQVDLHVEVMKEFLEAVKFKPDSGDKLYYTAGTEVHTKDHEKELAEKIGASTEDGVTVFDKLKISMNGRVLRWLHHGPSAGDGPNEGNSHRNWLKNKFFTFMRDGEMPPDFYVTSHVHKPHYTTYSGRIGSKYHTIHGIITPSWQLPTRYGKRASKGDKTAIGLWCFEVSKYGVISVEREPMMKWIDTNKAVLL